MELHPIEASCRRHGFLSGLVREPLLHFLIAGGLIFAVYEKMNPAPQVGKSTAQIVLSNDDVYQLTKGMLVVGNMPDKQQLLSLIEQRVNEEILFREGLALGLHKNDDVVRRRVAAKMHFLIGDTNGLKEPDTIELKALFEKDPDRFSIPPRVSFRQITFPADKPGARGRALEQLEKIASSSSSATSQSSSTVTCDLEGSFTEQTTPEIVKDHGLDFAKAVVGLKPGAWQGPVWSERGWNLVFVRSVEPSREPAFEEVVPLVRSAWLDDRQREIKRTALESLRKNYSVTAPSFETIDWAKLRAQSIFLD